MTFHVIQNDIVESEVDKIVLWHSRRGAEYAERWLRGFSDALSSLETMPTRCPIADESRYFGTVVRQLRYRDHRIIFRLVDSDGDGIEDTVSILHVHHVSRAPVYPLPDED
jgi:hypothetical protein